jgi:hypothetical protein
MIKIVQESQNENSLSTRVYQSKWDKKQFGQLNLDW